MGHVKNRDNQKIHDCVVDGVCDGCKGNPDYCNLNDCSMYGKEYDEIEKEWEVENDAEKRNT